MTLACQYESVDLIDCHYTGPHQAGCFLVTEGGRAAFVDNNTARAVPHLLAALDERGLRPEQVDYAIITHVHLDHAGGTSALLEHCPNAVVLAHPKAARHIIDPSRLVKGAQAVYGEAAFAELYGEITGVDASRVRAMDDGETIHWGERRLRFIHTLGHASHHFCIYDDKTDGVFTGDAFGLSRTTLSRSGPSFVIASSAPPDFDPGAAHESVDKILATGAARAYLPHFAVLDDLEGAAKQLRHSIDWMAAIVEEAAASDLDKGALTDFCITRMETETRAHLRWCGVADLESDYQWFEADVLLNAMGLSHLAAKQREAQ